MENDGEVGILNVALIIYKTNGCKIDTVRTDTHPDSKRKFCLLHSGGYSGDDISLEHTMLSCQGIYCVYTVQYMFLAQDMLQVYSACHDRYALAQYSRHDWNVNPIN